MSELSEITAHPESQESRNEDKSSGMGIRLEPSQSVESAVGAWQENMPQACCGCPCGSDRLKS